MRLAKLQIWHLFFIRVLALGYDHLACTCHLHSGFGPNQMQSAGDTGQSHAKLCPVTWFGMVTFRLSTPWHPLEGVLRLPAWLLAG